MENLEANGGFSSVEDPISRSKALRGMPRIGHNFLSSVGPRLA